MIRRNLSILLATAIVSCQSNASKHEKAVERYGWEVLKIKVDNRDVWVPAGQDTCFFSELFEDSVYAKAHKGARRIESQKFRLSKAERDTLFALAEDAIKNHKETDQDVSCYGGQYVTITLEMYNSSISCKYKSIYEWTSVSPTLARLKRMTFDTVEQVKMRLKTQ